MARSIEIVSNDARTSTASGAATRRRITTSALERYAVVALIVLALAGFGLRVSGIGAVGFAEDEINKLEAVRAYGRGDITPNAEHPMVMKTLIFVSMRAAQVWNEATADPAARISDEAALRFPNVLIGALTVFPLFLLTAAFFDRRTALLAAALWSFGINAVTYNRIAKEDTLMVFFMLFAFYFYLRAKQTSGYDYPAKRRRYVLGAVSFGLMLASKYFPHYFGLNMLFHHVVQVRRREPDEPRGKTPAIFYILFVAVFLLANPAILLPETWNYLGAYSSEKLLTHRGYLMGAHLYENTMSKTPFGGTPVYFYLLFLLIKMPLVVLGALVVGVVEIARRWRREPGAAFLLLMFVLWIVPYSLVGAKWLRYTLSLMPLVYMMAAVGITALARGAVGLLRRRCIAFASQVVWGAAVVVFVALPALIAYAQRPHHALYTNALAAGRAGYYFPHDEFYDDGLREAIGYVGINAPPGATIAHETPGVAKYYLEKFGRTDLRSRVISDSRFDVADAPAPLFVILQRGRAYFENRDEREAIRNSTNFIKVYEGTIRGASAVEVYARR